MDCLNPFNNRESLVRSVLGEAIKRTCLNPFNNRESLVQQTSFYLMRAAKVLIPSITGKV